MLPDPQDTIVALATAAGPGERAIVRLSGPRALPILAELFRPAGALERAGPFLAEGCLHLAGLHSPLPAEVYLWKAPRSLTGQDAAELHTVSSPPLVELLIEQILKRGARAAQPGEFTLRAFLAGKLDLPRAEAVLGVIEAGDRDELKTALAQYAGGLAPPLQALRDDLLDLLAEVEAGLDFVEEEIEAVPAEKMLTRLAKGLAAVTLLQKQVAKRATANRPFRVVLLGRPNAGKSSLFNALVGEAQALVSAEAGTTRDYLVRRLAIEGVEVELVDTAGLAEAGGELEARAQELAHEQARDADLVLYCQEPGGEVSRVPPLCGKAPVVTVGTKADLGEAAVGLATSAATGAGLGAIKALVAERARGRRRPAMAPGLSRCRHHLDRCLGRLRQAHSAVLFQEPAEVLAVELRAALDELGELVGAVYSEDVLERIFSRFCIGK